MSISTQPWRKAGTRVLAVVTAAGVLTLGGATVAFAQEGAPSGSVNGTASAEHRVRRHVRLHALRLAFATAADTLGMSTDELRAELRDGPRSIAMVAGDQTGAVVDAIVAALTAKIDAAVARGDLTAERADAMKQQLPDRAERFVNWVPGSRRR